jgi:hypothetical protein
MKPNFLNLFVKKFTRDLVVATISASSGTRAARDRTAGTCSQVLFHFDVQGSVAKSKQMLVIVSASRLTSKQFAFIRMGLGIRSREGDAGGG